MTRFTQRIGKHVLSGIKYPDTGWLLTCAAFPDISSRYAGADDASEAIEEFERRATAAQEAKPQLTTEG